MRNFIKCDICGNPIYTEDEQNYGDEYYEIDGYSICPDCIMEYLKDNYRRTAREYHVGNQGEL